MIWICCFLKILQVARRAYRREPFKLPNGCLLMAILALHGSVGTKEREAILVILDLLCCDLPTQHRMALRAIRPELPPVNVCVTIRTVLADVGENWLHMALRALNFFVHSSQRIAGLVVIKLGNRANRAPARGRVTVLARNRKWSMRTASAAALLGCMRSTGGGPA
jgi:hypothetical protein